MSLKDFIRRKIRSAVGTDEIVAAVNRRFVAGGPLSNDAREIIRAQTLNRWKAVDAMDRLLFPDDFKVTCGICGHSAEKQTYRTMVTYCMFGGGRIERFVCPRCGCIFGPLKMLVLDPKELEEEYRLCFTAYTWALSAHEIMTAESVVTDRDKTYLNYGSGGDLESGSAAVMRKRGYRVYAYEPYAQLDGAPDWVIRSKERLRDMKFDAIYSNDLLEHLADPAAELGFMKSLLKDENSFLEHSTSCFEYRQEYSRFHLFFFTGISLEYLCRKCGLVAELVANEERRPGRQYISYRFYHAGRA